MPGWITAALFLLLALLSSLHLTEAITIYHNDQRQDGSSSGGRLYCLRMEYRWRKYSMGSHHLQVTGSIGVPQATEEELILQYFRGLKMMPSHRKRFPQPVTTVSEGYVGRVQMKVFRGPTAQSGDWAPHGYWVRQPADNN